MLATTAAGALVLLWRKFFGVPLEIHRPVFLCRGTVRYSSRVHSVPDRGVGIDLRQLLDVHAEESLDKY